MSKLKLGGIIFVVFIIGVFVGVSGNGNSSTTSSQEIKQPTSTSNPVPTEKAKDTGKVEIKSETQRVGITGNTEVVGEVINNTDKPVYYVKVIATFYNEEGTVIGTGFTYAGDTADTPLEVGATTPFQVSSYPNKFNATRIKLEVAWR